MVFDDEQTVVCAGGSALLALFISELAVLLNMLPDLAILHCLFASWTVTGSELALELV